MRPGLAVRLASAAVLSWTSAATAQTAGFRTVHIFQGGADGAWPVAGLAPSGGMLYGTTDAGGGAKACSGGCGTVYALDPAAGSIRILHAFRGKDTMAPAGSVLAAGHLLYGTGFGGTDDGGAVFATASGSGATKILHRFGRGDPDGYNAASGLLLAGGLLYGTTEHGGAGGSGVVFSIDPRTGAEHVPLDFVATDGFQPRSGLTKHGGLLFGTTYGGGAHGCGEVFSLNPATAAFTTIHAFQCAPDSTGPLGTLVDAGGTLYGTSETGGTANLGTVYGVDPVTGAERVVHSFTGADGVYPFAALIASGGVLFGTASQGGPGNAGIVFSMDPSTGRETVLHAFQGPDGSRPSAALTDLGGTLYGTTTYGGGGPCANGCGTIFAVTP